MEDPNTHNRLSIESQENLCNPKQDVTGSNPVTRSTIRLCSTFKLGLSVYFTWLSALVCPHGVRPG